MSFLRSAPWLEVLPDAAFVLLEVAYGAAICAAWRAVQGRAELQKIFVIHFYYSGVFLMFMAAWFMLLMGVMRAVDPASSRSHVGGCVQGRDGFVRSRKGANRLVS